jgi:hypothetical protein
MMIPTIIDYMIITFQPKLGKANPDKLTELVKQHMEDGWAPFGGIQSNNAILYQAMVKYQ